MNGVPPHDPPPELVALLEQIQARAVLFAHRYGALDGWTDEAVERALEEHGMPPIDELPTEPPFTEAEWLEYHPDQPLVADGTSPEDQAAAWQRLNALHLLGHVMLQAGRRCEQCVTW